MAKPVVLVILDGWGLAPPGPGNAISLAKTPCYRRLWSVFPKTQLLASGEAVGLPRKEKGNSETGHLNLGAGRVVFQDLPRIDLAIANGSFFRKNNFLEAIKHVEKNKSRLHLMGLIGAGGVHSSLSHLIALLRLAKNSDLKKVYLHFFTDGRDSPPTSALTYIDKIESEISKFGVGKMATLCGRYYAMDRDNRWERTKKAYEAITLGKGVFSLNLNETIKKSYQNGKTDEFLEPIILDKEGLVNDNDAVIFFNFRIDRPRQLTKAFVLADFEKLKMEKAGFDPYAEKYGLKIYELPLRTRTFRRKKVCQNLFFVTMTEYEPGLPVQVAFPPEPVKIPLARVISDANLRQLHLAETEKERFTTYYFDGQRSRSFPGEDWVEIPSPKVATYDLKPEMAARELTAEAIKRIKQQTYDFILINFANPDMVGHTGNIKAGIKACEVVDDCLNQLISTTISLNGVCLVTADHGNIEEMINPLSGEIDTEHSENPVPFIFVAQGLGFIPRNLSSGFLADVAPTVLAILEIEKPSMMTGKNLLS